MKNILAIFTVIISIVPSEAVFAQLTPFQEKIQAIMSMEHRNAVDRARDRNRDPITALEFFGLQEDMKVIEFIPGSGWYTKILAPLLKEKGELHMVYKSEWLDDLDNILILDGMNKAIKLPVEMDWNEKEYRYEFGDLDFGMSDADMVLNIREYHNFNLEGKTKLNNEVFESLKPGGIYVIVDHSRRPMSPETHELGRREDPVKVILEVQSAGFVLEKSSDMFYRPDDELRYEVGRQSVRGNTDRFTLVFRKPGK